MFSTMQEMIGKQVIVAFEKVWVLCTILDAKQVWGRVDYLVSPVNGRYQQWVSEGRINPSEDSMKPKVYS